MNFDALRNSRGLIRSAVISAALLVGFSVLSIAWWYFHTTTTALDEAAAYEMEVTVPALPAEQIREVANHMRRAPELPSGSPELPDEPDTESLQEQEAPSPVPRQPQT